MACGGLKPEIVKQDGERRILGCPLSTQGIVQYDQSAMGHPYTKNVLCQDLLLLCSVCEELALRTTLNHCSQPREVIRKRPRL